MEETIDDPKANTYRKLQAAIAELRRCELEARRMLDREQPYNEEDPFYRGYWLGRAQSWEDSVRMIEEAIQ